MATILARPRAGAGTIQSGRIVRRPATSSSLWSTLRVRTTVRNGMPTTELRTDLPPQAVWATLTDVNAWPEWGPTVFGARVDGDVELTLGTRGTITTVAGVSVPFEICEFVDGRLWAWRVAGVNATRHEVIPVAGGCILSFGAPVWAVAYLPILAIALPRIERIAAGL